MTIELVKKRRDRTIAVILGAKEREIDPFLPADVSSRFRKLILDQINDLVDLCLDTPGDGFVWNEDFMHLMYEIHAAVVPDAEDG